MSFDYTITCEEYYNINWEELMAECQEEEEGC